MMRRARQLIVTVPLPLPPSVNSAFASRRGTHRVMKTASYRFWQAQVRDMYGDGSGLPLFRGGPYGLFLDIPRSMKGDTDNRTKLVSDVLRMPKSGQYGLAVVLDDSLMGPNMVNQVDLPADRCIATVVAVEMWADYVGLRL